MRSPQPSHETWAGEKILQHHWCKAFAPAETTWLDLQNCSRLKLERCQGVFSTTHWEPTGSRVQSDISLQSQYGRHQVSSHQDTVREISCISAGMFSVFALTPPWLAFDVTGARSGPVSTVHTVVLVLLLPLRVSLVSFIISFLLHIHLHSSQVTCCCWPQSRNQCTWRNWLHLGT